MGVAACDELACDNECRDIWIELIDQNRLARIMLEKTDQPHGFGMRRTERGLVYITGVYQ